MKCEDLDRYLDDYLDGTLEKDRSGEVSSHLESCAACTERKDALARLLEMARMLPKEEAPARDLWPEIRERIERRQAGHGDRGGSGTFVRRKIFPVWVAAAAVVLTGTLVYWVMQNPGGPNGARYEMSEVRRPVTAPHTEAILASYGDTRDTLFAELEKRRDQLAPETVRVVMENMRIMDQAAGQIREALDRDPGNRGLQRMLMASYRKQVTLLRQANEIPTGM